MCFATLIMGAQDCTAGNWNGSHLEPSCLNQIHDTCKNHCTMDQILGFDEDLLQLLENEFLHLLTYQHSSLCRNILISTSAIDICIVIKNIAMHWPIVATLETQCRQKCHQATMLVLLAFFIVNLFMDTVGTAERFQLVFYKIFTLERKPVSLRPKPLSITIRSPLYHQLSTKQGFTTNSTYC